MKLRTGLLCLAGISLSLISSVVIIAAPVVSLSNTPVLTTAPVPPNIMLVIDTSGSMIYNYVQGTFTTRFQAAQNSAVAFLNGLTNIRVGLGRLNPYYSGVGADSALQVIVGVDNIGNNKTTMINAVNALEAGGNTPLGTVLHEIGRYFVQGFNNTLTMHPGTSLQTTKTAYSSYGGGGIFDQPPIYSAGIPQTSPIQSYCQKSFVIYWTDGEANFDTNINASTGLINYAGDCPGTSCPNLFDRTPAYCAANVWNDNFCGWTFGCAQNQPSCSSSGYLTDVSMALFDMDLRPDLTAPSGIVKKNNLSTYIITFSDLPSNPFLQEVALKGGGGSEIYADTPNTVLQAFSSINATVLSQVNTSSSVGFSASTLGNSNVLYQGQYNGLSWSGDLIAIALTSTGAIGSTLWDAATLLNSMSPNNRVIMTYNDTTKAGIPFRSTSITSRTATTAYNDLTKGPQLPNFSDAQQVAAEINYLRGDRTYENNGFRLRVNVLGDIVNSAPVYVGAPNSAWPDTSPFPTGSNAYSTFKTAQANRTPAVYVGANDGMLHGFNANTGAEILGYIPSNLYSTVNNLGLHYLTDPNYQHIFYVDQTPTIEDAYVKTSTNGSVSWHTVLVSGENNGGAGYFALDITNPSFTEAGAASTVMWQFTSANNNDLGQSYSQPIIGLMNNGRWAAVFGNGYNATGSNAAGALFILFLDGGLDKSTWTKGTDYIELVTKGSNTSLPNGLASPVGVDLNGSGTIDRIYVGDLQGHIYAADLTSSNTSSWVFTNSGNPIFTTPNNQPITTKPSVIVNPDVTTSTSNTPNLLISFGTGQLLSAADKLTTSTQGYYTIWDKGTTVSFSNLVQQTFTTTNNLRVLTNNPVKYTNTGSVQGCYMSFTGGERVLTNPQAVGGTTFFNTVLPNANQTCSSGGAGFIMAPASDTCGQTTNPVINTNNDTVLDSNDLLNGKVVNGVGVTAASPVQSSFIGSMMYTPLTNATVLTTLISNSSSTKTGRISWQEITAH